MTESLIVTFTFIIVLAIMFWMMNNEQAKRVTESLGKILKVLPISQIIKAFRGEINNSSTDNEP